MDGASLLSWRSTRFFGYLLSKNRNSSPQRRGYDVRRRLKLYSRGVEIIGLFEDLGIWRGASLATKRILLVHDGRFGSLVSESGIGQSRYHVQRQRLHIYGENRRC